MSFDINTLSRGAILAPMAGVADSAFRLLCKKYGAAATVSELISAEGLVRAVEKTRHLLNFTEAERPFAIQLFGADADHLAEAAALACEVNPDWIDLNFGCPAKKVTKRGAGAAVMQDLDLMQQIVRKVVKASPLPVTAKIRAGWDEHHLVAEEAARIIEGEGGVAVTVHARTRKQAFSGRADWNIIAQVRQAVHIPVIGNGDIFSAQDAQAMSAQTGCHAVMIGRGSYGRPWIFHQTGVMLSGRPPAADPDPAERMTVCLEHYELALATLEQNRAVKEMRKHIGWYVKGLRGASQLRQIVFHLSDPEAVRRTLIEFRERLILNNIDDEEVA